MNKYKIYFEDRTGNNDSWTTENEHKTIQGAIDEWREKHFWLLEQDIFQIEKVTW